MYDDKVNTVYLFVNKFISTHPHIYFSVPAGFPQNFTVKTINYSSLLLSWNDVEQNLWKGDIINYTFVCSNLQKNTTSFGQTPLYNGILYSLLPGTDYNCTVAACTKVGCGGYTPCFLVKTLPGSKLILLKLFFSFQMGKLINFIYSFLHHLICAFIFLLLLLKFHKLVQKLLMQVI